MSLSIGQLNLQLVGDSRGLRKLLPAMDTLGKKINEVARSQEKGSARTLSALNKQEQAVRRQIRSVQNLNAQIKRSGGPANLAGGNIQALKAFTTQMSKGALSVTKFNRANDRLTATLAKSSRSLKSFTSTQRKASAGKLTDSLRNLESASVLAIGPLSGLGARIRALGAIAGRSALKMALMFGAITAGIVGMFKLGQGAISAAKAMQNIESRLIAATGSSKQAAANFNFVEETATKMGINVRIAADSFSQLAAATRGTAAAGKITRTVFEGLSAAGATLRLTNEQVEGAFRAVQQIASKGRVQSEELIGQLAERIPNAIQIAAKAFDTTQAGLLELVQKGLVPASEFLDKFGKQLLKTFGAGATANVLSLVGSMNALSNAAFKFQRNLDSLTGTSKGFAIVVRGLARAITILGDNLRGIVLTLGAIAGAFIGLGAARVINAILKVGAFIRGLRNAVIGLVAVLGALTGGVKTLIALGAAVAGAALAVAGLDAVLGDVNTNFEALNDGANDVGKALKKPMKKSLDDVNEAIRKVGDQLFVLKNSMIISSKAALDLASKMKMIKLFSAAAVGELGNVNVELQIMGLLIKDFDAQQLELQATEKFNTGIKDLRTSLEEAKSKMLQLKGGLTLTTEAAVKAAIKFEVLNAFLKEGATSFKDLTKQAQAFVRGIRDIETLEISISGFEIQEKAIKRVETGLAKARGQMLALTVGLRLQNKVTINAAASMGILDEFLLTNTASMAKMNAQTNGAVGILLKWDNVLSGIAAEKAFQAKLDDIAKATNTAQGKILQFTLDLKNVDPVTVQLASKMGILKEVILELSGVTRSYDDRTRELINTFLELNAAARLATGLAKARAIIDKNLTVTERLKKQLTELVALRELAFEQFAGDPSGLTAALAVIDEAQKELRTGTRLAFEFGDAFASAFENAILAGQGLRKILQGILQDLLKILLRTLVTKPLGDAITAAIQPKARGGPVKRGGAFLVGEEGPELFTPDRNGNIIPNKILARQTGRGRGSNGGNIILHQTLIFETTVRDDVRAMIIESAPLIIQAADNFIRDNTQRSGILESFG